MAEHERPGREASRSSAGWLASPAFVRILPFALFIVFVALSSFLPAPTVVPPDQFDGRWLYAARAIVVGVLLLVLWPRYTELSGGGLSVRDWALALGSGGAVFAIWIVLDHGWMVLGDPEATGFDPRRYGTEELHWPLTVLRLLGLAVVVPIAEEIFWRSFLLRWLERPSFLELAPAAVGIRALAISSVLFALEHNQWLAGLIAGFVYGWIYVRSGKLWVAVIAHAVTNAALGAYVLLTGDWRFW
jgi:CAAX prenyl protease-like protein